ncbi:gamma-aminobutyric acid receptor subunit theta isoform X2 [Perognathus longimembris pacificus]|uniref:gamma-aminobutyric acid receptor subunit theta isoform X2 n=1 Tax=Perognathus longimembris pacificus TaxID=214514 RepID=UPI002019A7CB|nr:gamma-aminobutyric acid receptor subunit theta isoform X2 [Perognathus longimembris pacificus]
MGIRAMLRAAALLLLIRTWLAEGNDPQPTPHFQLEFSSALPKIVVDLFKCKNCAHGAVVQKILDRVLSKYDVRLRPNFGGAPVPVGISIYVSNIEQISEINMTWKDSRLSYYETNLNLTLDYRMHEKLWVPDCYFLNSKDAYIHDVTVDNRVFQLHPDGTVRYGIRLTTKAACSLDLQKYPLDKQACKLEVESYGYTVEDIVLSWEDNENAIRMAESLQIPQFAFLGRTITSKEVYFYTGSYMRLVLNFQVQREVGSYLVQVYWPTVLTTVLSWISFWMNYDSSAARVTIGLTAILVLTTIDSHLREKLPHISCIKAIDIYILVCLFFVFLSLLEYVYINYLFFSEGPRRHRRRQRRPRRVVAHYRYQEVVVGNVQDGLINVEDGIGSLPANPVQARLASPESLGSLASTSERAPLATPEILSPLSSPLGWAQLATGESLSDLPSTSQQALHAYGSGFASVHSDDSVTPVEIHNPEEAHGYAETSDDEDYEDYEDDILSLDETQDHGPSSSLLLPHGQRCVEEESWDLDKIQSLPDDINDENTSLDLEEQHKGNTDSVWSLKDDDFLAYDQEKDSGSDSEDSRPPSPGCSFTEGFSFHLFNPDYVPKIDRWSRVLFPLSFALFNVVYWLYHFY